MNYIKNNLERNIKHIQSIIDKTINPEKDESIFF